MQLKSASFRIGLASKTTKTIVEINIHATFSSYRHVSCVLTGTVNIACDITIDFIIHQTHYEKSDFSRAINQFTIACELDMINVISAADITFIMSSSTSTWLLCPLECSAQKQNG